jgi:hypothetical protein
VRHSASCVTPGSSIGRPATTARTIVGFDPSAHGSIAVLDEARDLLEINDLPATPEANGRSATNAVDGSAP